MIRILRSILFDICFYILIAFYMIYSISVLSFKGQAACYRGGEWWSRAVRFLARNIVGLDIKIEGLENLPDEPVIVASKHMSAWDTVIFVEITRTPAWVLKIELTRIPLYGQFLKDFGHVEVDRAQGASALKNLLRGAKRVLKQEKRDLIIFPEGTRVAPGDAPDYKPGVAGIYAAMKDVKVVPVASNIGCFWGRRALVKKPGLATLKFLPPIEPGLDKEVFMKELENHIETESNKLIESVQ